MLGLFKGLVPPPDLRVPGATIYLRPPAESDFAEWAALRQKSRDFLIPWEPTWPRDALTKASWRRRLRHYGEEWHDGTSYSFLLFRNRDDALLGGITLSNVRRGVAQTGTIGYWVGASYARQGVMTEGVQVVLGFSFNDLGLHRIEAACLPGNTASRSLLAKCGFREEGYAPQYLKINGAWEDHVLFALLASEMKQRGAQACPASTDKVERSTPSLANALSHLVSRS